MLSKVQIEGITLRGWSIQPTIVFDTRLKNEIEEVEEIEETPALKKVACPGVTYVIGLQLCQK